MGNNHAKKQKKPQFSANELDVLESSFHNVAGAQKQQITEPTLMQHWSTKSNKHLAQYMANFMYKPAELSQRPIDPEMKGARLLSISFVHYTQPFYYVERGSTNEQAQFIMDSLENVSKDSVQYSQVQMYIKTVIRSYLQILNTRDRDPYKIWFNLGFGYTDDDLEKLSVALMSNLDQCHEQGLQLDDIEKWLETNVIVLQILRQILCYLYGFCPGQSSSSQNPSQNLPSTSQSIVVNSVDELITSPSRPFQTIIPTLTGFPQLDSSTHYKPILNILQVIYLNSIIPNQLSKEWRFLFSSHIMGESFSTMLGKIIDQGPTLIIIEDEDGDIFGGYAPHSWTLGSKFIGDNTTMLFTLNPNINCFNATGYNDHYQYLNLHQETMPNGLGIGGQFNYWGLWLSCDYGIGQSSEVCTTFRNYKQLSKTKDFRIRCLEVWGVGELEKEEVDESVSSTSILNKNLEDRVMLELSGQKMHSDGLRDDPD